MLLIDQQQATESLLQRVLVGAAPALPAAIVGILWFLLVIWLLRRYRQPLSDAISALAKKIKEGAGFRAGPIEVWPSPSTADTSAPGAGAPADQEAEELTDFRRRAAGLLSHHLHYHPTLLAVGPSPFGRARTRRSVGTGDAFTLAQIHAAIGGPFGVGTRVSLVPDERVARDIARSQLSIISVGGPVANPLVTYLMDQFPIPLRFNEVGLAWPERDRTWQVERDADGNPLEDWVLVFGGPNPVLMDGWCTAIAAIDGMGSVHAARLLMTQSMDGLGYDASEGYVMIIHVGQPPADDQPAPVSIEVSVSLG